MSVGDIADREERPAMVKFEKRPVEDKKASREAGFVVYKDVDFVKVVPPYSKECFENKAESWFDNVEKNVRIGRTPPEWRDHWRQSYESWKKGEAAPLNGTSVKNWPAITPAQCKTILNANIHTIEDLALVNDEGARRLGMGGLELKNKAKAYVQAIKDTGPLVMENAALKKEVENQNATINNLSEKVDILSNQLQSMRASPLVEVSREPTLGEEVFAPEPDTKTIQEQYIEKFGKKPHHLMKEATILKKLAE
jgi:hypothetical protein